LVEVDTRKAIALLAYLAMHGESLSRDTLATLFWPEYDQSQARANLRRTLSALVKAVGKEWLEIDRETIGLVQNDHFWLDVAQFRRLLAQSNAHHSASEVVCAGCLDLLHQALGLYHADFMAGFNLRDSPEFDEWQFFQRESLRREVMTVLGKLVVGHAAQGEFELAIIYANRWAALDPLDEEAHHQLMQLYAWSGQRSAALRQYQELVRVLDEELGVEPQKALQELHHAIEVGAVQPPPITKPKREMSLQAERPASASQPEPVEGRQPEFIEGSRPAKSRDSGEPVEGPPPPPALPRHNLPASTTSFIGREAELAELTALLANSACRLLSLIGPGGIGKTRLAVEAALTQQEIFTDGVWFIPLTSISGAEFIATAIGDALPMTLYGPDDPKAQLLRYLQGKNLLLVLDNMEHLLEGCDLLAEILREAPTLKLLVTSRERLNLHGEWVFEIEGLAVPPIDQVDNLESYSAVALFLQTARRTQAAFKLTREEHPAVIQICRLMEGMPLGIELAAAWVHLLSCAEIAQEIERNLDFLTVTARDMPERHRSLRAAFDHSWNLLPAEERRVLRRLSVFQGDFRREAAEYVARANLPLLSALVDKSLLRRTEVGRYDLHELVRQYASSHFQEVPQDQGDTYDRHCSYYVRWLVERDERLRSSAQTDTIAELKADLDNLRLAWRWAVAQHRIIEIKQFIRPLSWFYELCGWYQEAEMLLHESEMMLRQSIPEEGPDTQVELDQQQVDYRLALGEVLAHQGYFCLRGGEHRRSQALLEEAAGLLASGEDQLAQADTLMWLGFVTSRHQGNYAQAEALFHQSLALSREIGNLWNVGMALTRLGALAHALNRSDEAYRLFRESLEILRRLGDPSGTAYCLSSLGFVATGLGRHVEAQSFLQESLAISREIGNHWETGFSLAGLGLNAQAQGHHLEAQQLFEESIRSFREVGDQWHIARTLTLLGRAKHALGDCPGASRRFQEALKTARNIQATTLMLQTAASWAALLADFQETRPLAAELFLAILNHPAITQSIQDRIKTHLAELETHLPTQLLEAVQTRPLDKLVEELLYSTL
jgi:predicted ATPase/DNA-binding SARP family transcriptional activator